jgi:hypothetical protein
MRHAPPVGTDGPSPHEWPSFPIIYTSTASPALKSQYVEQQTGEMVASAEDVVVEEQPVHQGCMAGFLHLFDRPQINRFHRMP